MKALTGYFYPGLVSERIALTDEATRLSQELFSLFQQRIDLSISIYQLRLNDLLDRAYIHLQKVDRHNRLIREREEALYDRCSIC